MPEVQEEDPNVLAAERNAAGAKRDEALEEAFRFEAEWSVWSWLWTLLFAPGIPLGRLTGAYRPIAFYVCALSAWFLLMLPAILAARLRYQPLDGSAGLSELAVYALPCYFLLTTLGGVARMPKVHLLADRKVLAKHVWALEQLLVDWPAPGEIPGNVPWADRDKVDRLAGKLIAQLRKIRRV